MTNQAALLDAALKYAGRGWPVFPLSTPINGHCSCKDPKCGNIGKHPRTKHGLKDATTDEGLIRTWWRDWPAANIGLLTGSQSGFVVVDVDPRHGGDDTLTDLKAKYGDLPHTVEQLTGGHGRHLLFQYPGNGAVIKNSAGAVGLGLDVRGDGGYIVAAPSLHKSGQHYTWEISSQPDDVALAPLPAWLSALLQGASKSRTPSVVDEDGGIPEGKREQALLKMAGQLRRNGLGSKQIFPSLAETNRDLCKPPLNERDVHRIAESVCRYTPEASVVEHPKAQPGKEEAAPAALHFTSCGDLLSEPAERISWLVDQYLPSSGLSILAGKPKAGKSTLARCLALAVARGDPWLESITSRGAVFYLALEEKRSEVSRHFQDMGATGEDDIHFFIEPSPHDGMALLRQAAENVKPALIIVDPLIKMVRVKDLNDYAQVSPALEPLLSLARETGAHVMAVHHLGKGEREGGDSMLGSTAILAAADTAFFLKRSEKYRTIHSIQRYGTDMKEITLNMDEATRVITAGAPRQEVDQAQVGEAILAHLRGLTEPAEEKDINEGVEGRRTTKFSALRKLFDEGKVTRTGDGKRGKPYLYSVSVSQVPTLYGEIGTQKQVSELSAGNGGSVSSSGVKAETVSSTQEIFPPKDPENHTPNQGVIEL